MSHGALLHDPNDDVAVVIQDSAAGTQIRTVTLDGKEVCTVKAADKIPLGHKIAVRDIAEGNEVIEYGHPIGKASQSIARGSHVHTHNLKSIRWGN